MKVNHMNKDMEKGKCEGNGNDRVRGKMADRLRKAGYEVRYESRSAPEYLRPADAHRLPSYADAVPKAERKEGSSWESEA